VRNTGSLFSFLIRSLLDKIYISIWVYIRLYLCKARRKKRTPVLCSDGFPGKQPLMSTFILVSGLKCFNRGPNSALLRHSLYKDNVSNKKMNLGHRRRYTSVTVYV